MPPHKLFAITFQPSLPPAPTLFCFPILARLPPSPHPVGLKAMMETLQQVQPAPAASSPSMPPSRSPAQEIPTLHHQQAGRREGSGGSRLGGVGRELEWHGEILKHGCSIKSHDATVLLNLMDLVTTWTPGNEDLHCAGDAFELVSRTNPTPTPQPVVTNSPPSCLHLPRWAHREKLTGKFPKDHFHKTK